MSATLKKISKPQHRNKNTCIKLTTKNLEYLDTQVCKNKLIKIESQNLEYLARWPFTKVDKTDKLAICAGLVIEYITQTNKYPSIPTQEATAYFIKQIRAEIAANQEQRLQTYLDNWQYFHLYPMMTDNLLIELLMNAIQDKKYTTLTSPPFPAGLFKDLFLTGRDGQSYKSSHVGNTWHWVNMHSNEMSAPGAN